MADEQIKLDLAIPDSFWQDFDRRISDTARRFQQELTRSGASAAGGGGGPAGSSAGLEPGGGGGKIGQAVSSALGLPEGAAAGIGAVADVGMKTFEGASQGIRNVRGAATGSSRVLADAAITGGLSSFVESTVGKIPVLGDILVAQMNAAKDAIEIPRDRATANLQGVYGSLAKGGYVASDDELNQALAFQNQIQQQGYEQEQRIDRMNREQHPTSAAFGLTWNGGT